MKIDVKRGFGRNYLIANHKTYASKENINQVEKIKNELSKKDQEKESCETTNGKINNKLFIKIKWLQKTKICTVQ